MRLWSRRSQRARATRRVRYFVQTDVEQFHRHLANAKWSDALSEYRGDFCSGCDQDGLDSADWLSKERERLRSEWRQAALNLINEHEQVGDHLHAAEIARKLLEVDALDEEALMAFVRASAAAGHREEALEKYSRFEIMLREELGLEPMENVQQLIAAIRTGNNRHGVRQEHSLLEPRLVYASSVPTPGRVTEWQTLERAWDQQQVVDQSDQLLLYADLVRKVMPGKQLRLQFAVLTKSRDPKIQLLETTFDESKLDRTKRIFQAVWSAIQSGHFYPSPSPMQCPSCGYRKQCGAWRGN